MRTVTVSIDDEDLRLLRRDVKGQLESFVYRGYPEADQSTEWRQAARLNRLYERLALAFKVARRRVRQETPP